MYRFLRRYSKHRGTVRPYISEGCIEKIDINIVKYIMFDYPSKSNEIKFEIVLNAEEKSWNGLK
ncbi:hypothetical protein [Clostridium tagluense]|uniref:Uncharacterized protein n=1 Tax=Clostridium tagluense TaxID=360422 RepID=A0A401UPW2_9CLOT|nr:hypothetical protein [Clostridium tagluense]GCD11564.1 hypothetical protein Ctaglu_31870 [Clostridium tagluense]